MSFLKKLLPLAANAIGTYFGGPAVGAAAGSATGALLGSGSQKKQANASIADYNAAQAGSINAFTGARDASLGYYQPYSDAGAQGLQTQRNMLTPGYDYQSNDPGYQYLVDQMQNATTRGAAAGHQLGSGGFYKALQQNSAGLAAQDFGNAFARNGVLAGYGMDAARGMTGAQNSYAGGVSNALFAGARGRDPARVNKGQAISDQYGAASDLGSTILGMFGQGGGGFAPLSTPGGGSVFGAYGSGGNFVDPNMAGGFSDFVAPGTFTGF